MFESPVLVLWFYNIR